MKLREYQKTALEHIKSSLEKGYKAPLLVLPTGAGKTVIFSELAKEFVNSGKKVLILVHRRELLQQACNKLDLINVKYGIISAGFKCQRNLSAGIPGDVGDIYGIPNCVIQVCDWQDKSKACLVKPREVETQRENAGMDFVASMVRFRGGNWRVVLTPEQFNTLLQAALQ